MGRGHSFRRIKILVVAILTSSFVSACGGGGSGSSPPPPPISPPPPPSNSAPVAADQMVAVDYGAVLAGGASASDADGDGLTFELVTAPLKGDLTLNSDGSFSYTPNVFVIDSDSFEYRANDGQTGSNVATVAIEITRSAEISAKYALRDSKNAFFAETVNANPGQSIIDQMVQLDLDADGDDDLLVTQFMNPRGDLSDYQELPLAVFRNVNGSYVREATNIAVNMGDAAIDDFNGDGLLDVFIGNAGFDDEPFPGGQSRLLFQNLDGTLTDVTATNVPTALQFTNAVCSGDFDSDNDQDLYLAIVNMEHQIYENDGQGAFTVSTTTILPPEMQSTVDPEVSFQWCEVADFNLDQRDDLVLGQQHIGRPENQIRDALGNDLEDSLVVLYGSAGNVLVTDYSTGLIPVTWDLDNDMPQVVDIEALDVDGDNCTDLVVSSVTGGSVGQVILDPASNFAVHFGDCTGGFNGPTNFTIRPISDSANTLLVTDFNTDGFPDFANRYLFDPFSDGGIEVPPVAEVDYDSSAYINNQSMSDPFVNRPLTLWDVEQLSVIGFLGLIHESLP